MFDHWSILYRSISAICGNAVFTKASFPKASCTPSQCKSWNHRRNLTWSLYAGFSDEYKQSFSSIICVHLVRIPEPPLEIYGYRPSVATTANREGQCGAGWRRVRYPSTKHNKPFVVCCCCWKWQNCFFGEKVVWVGQTSWKEKEQDSGWTAVKVKEETGSCVGLVGACGQWWFLV